MEGHGTYKWSDGTIYEGDWKDGKMHVLSLKSQVYAKKAVLAFLHSIVMRLSSLRIKDQGLWTED